MGRVRSRWRWRTSLAVLLAGPVVAAACAGADEAIEISGSSTVEPISIAVAERFADIRPAVQTIVDGPGTGDGFKLFCAGETDINDASSKIKPEQVEECSANGISFVELPIASDGIAIMTSIDNDAVECLSFADLYALTGPESQGIDRWSQAEELARALGSTTTLPDLPLDITGPGEESGTYASYVELVLEDIAAERGIEDVVTRPDYQASGDDNITIRAVQGSPSAFGWVGFAFAGAASGVKLLAVDGGDGTCVAPSPGTIADGSYPVARPLFIYVNPEHVAAKPALADFVDLYLSDEGVSAVATVGYVPLPAEAMAATRQRWADRVTGAAGDERDVSADG